MDPSNRTFDNLGELAESIGIKEVSMRGLQPFPFCLRERIFVEYIERKSLETKREAFILFVDRSRPDFYMEPPVEGIYLTPEMLYLPKKVKRLKKVISRYVDDSMAFFHTQEEMLSTLVQDKGEKVSEVDKGSKKVVKIPKKVPLHLYLMLVDACPMRKDVKPLVYEMKEEEEQEFKLFSSKKVMLRYEATPLEFSVIESKLGMERITMSDDRNPFKNPLSPMEMSNEKRENLSKLSSLSCQYYRLLERKSIRIPTIRLDRKASVDAISEAYADYEKGRISKKVVIQKYIELRHSIFLKGCLSAMNLDESTAERSFKEAFGPIDSEVDKQTPDCIEWDIFGKRARVVEVTVTDGNSRKAFSSKWSKYYPSVKKVMDKYEINCELLIIVYCAKDSRLSIRSGSMEEEEWEKLKDTMEGLKKFDPRNIIPRERKGSFEDDDPTDKEVGTDEEDDGEEGDEGGQAQDEDDDAPDVPPHEEDHEGAGAEVLGKEKKAIMNNISTDLCKEMLRLKPIKKKKALKASSHLEGDAMKDTSEKDLFYQEEDDKLKEIKAFSKNFSPEDYKKTLVSEMKKLCNMVVEKEEPKDLSVFKVFEIKIGETITTVEESLNKHMSMGSRMRLAQKIPKLTKFPLMYYMNKKTEKCVNSEVFPDNLGVKMQYDDGTMMMKVNDDHEDNHNDNRAGIGICKEDVEVVDHLYECMVFDSSQDFRRFVEGTYPEDDFIKEICKFACMEWFWMASNMFRNLAYLEGRRKILKKLGKTNAAYKYFEKEGYGIIIKKGTAMTQEKQIRYKVVSSNPCYGTGEMSFRNMYKSKNGDYWETKWLAINMADVKHFTQIFEKAISIMSLYKDNYEENTKRKGSYFKDNMHRSKATIVPLMVLLEHKRGTSTTLQYNRYIIHSLTSWMSDKQGIIKDIMSDPVRSTLEAYVRISQFKWCVSIMKSIKPMWMTCLKSMTSDKSDYDKVEFPNIFDPEFNVEFSWLMNDMYLGNMFEKGSGFISHRSKAIMLKMAKEERSFLNNRTNPAIEGIMTMDQASKGEDIHHTFSRDFVCLMGKEFDKKVLEKKGGYGKVLLMTLTKNCKEMMQLTSSLKSGPYPHGIMYSGDVVKDFSFSNILEEIEKKDTSSLLKMVSEEVEVNSLFSLFPKSQIGGPREILIQYIKTRFLFKFMEDFFRNLSTLHEKDTMTNATRKFNVQSNDTSSFKKMVKAMTDDPRYKNYVPISLSLNTDASRWAPSKNMLAMMYFVCCLSLPNEVKETFLSLLCSMCKKVMFLPKSLKDKWMKKPIDEKEGDDDLEWLRKRCMGNYDYVHMFSGMGQGMLHFYSSIEHDAKDDIMDYLTKEILISDDFRMRSSTLISSDDMTKFLQVYYKRGKAPMVEVKMRQFMIIYDVTNRLANIHTNWKKTGLQVMLKEFNSYFTRGKRACIATIKDCYTGIQVVDLTEPEDAVRMCLSGLKRCFFNGVYMTTIRTMARLTRVWMKEMYRTNELTEALMMKFDIEDENLIPYQLGFFPASVMLMEAMMYGPEILMYNRDNNDKLKRFYTRLYTASQYEDASLPEQPHEYKEPVTGKFRLLLRTLTDKRIKKKRDEFDSKWSEDMTDLKEMMNKYALCNNTYEGTPGVFSSFFLSYLMAVTRKYEINETASVHSMIRALSMSTKKAYLYPTVDDEVCDIMSFTDFILNRDEGRSLFFLTRQCIPVAESYYRNMEALKGKGVSEGNRHPKMRKLRMFSQKIGDMMSVDEFLKELFSMNRVQGNRFLKLANSLSAYMQVDANDLIYKPEETIMKFYDRTDTPFLTFKKLLDYYLRSMKFYSCNMICNCVDQVDAESNLLNLHLEKEEPSELYTLNRKEVMGYYKRTFMTDMSLIRGGCNGAPGSSNMCHPPMVRLNAEEEKDFKEMVVYHRDSTLTKAAKMSYYWHKATNKDKWVKTFSSDFVYYQQKMVEDNKKMQIYTDLITTAYITHSLQQDDPTVTVYMVSTDQSKSEKSDVLLKVQAVLSSLAQFGKTEVTFLKHDRNKVNVKSVLRIKSNIVINRYYDSDVMITPKLSHTYKKVKLELVLRATGMEEVAFRVGEWTQMFYEDVLDVDNQSHMATKELLDSRGGLTSIMNFMKTSGWKMDKTIVTVRERDAVDPVLAEFAKNMASMKEENEIYDYGIESVMKGFDISNLKAFTEITRETRNKDEDEQEDEDDDEEEATKEFMEDFSKSGLNSDFFQILKEVGNSYTQYEEEEQTDLYERRFVKDMLSRVLNEAMSDTISLNLKQSKVSYKAFKDQGSFTVSKFWNILFLEYIEEMEKNEENMEDWFILATFGWVTQKIALELREKVPFQVYKAGGYPRSWKKLLNYIQTNFEELEDDLEEVDA